MDEQGHHTSERTEADGNDEQHCEDHLVNGAAGVHQAAHRLEDPPGDDVFGAHQAKRNGEDDCQRGTPDGDLHGDRHFAEIVTPLAEVRREEVGGEGRHVAGIFDQHQRVHFRTFPGDDEHRQQDGPAQKREPAAFRGWDGDGLHEFS
ncbi:hypothetical protein D3C75_676240 [compost metagenome]